MEDANRTPKMGQVPYTVEMLLAWAKEACGVDNLENFFEVLARDPHCQEAAAGIFWLCQSISEVGTIPTQEQYAQEEEQIVDRLLASYRDEANKLDLEGVELEVLERALGLIKRQIFSSAAGELTSTLKGWVLGEPSISSPTGGIRSDLQVMALLAASLVTLLVTEARVSSESGESFHYTEDIRDTLAIGYRNLRDDLWTDADPEGSYYYEFSGDDEDWIGFTVTAAHALVLAEYGSLQAADGRHEEALLHFYCALGRLYWLWLLSEELIIPHLGQPFGWVEHGEASHHFSQEVLVGDRRVTKTWWRGLSAGIKEVINIYETLSKPPHGEAVQDWEGVSWSCENIADYLRAADFGEVYYAGAGVDLYTYWKMASARAEVQLSPSQFREMLIQQERDRHQERLRKDFFDPWAELEKETQECLISAEVDWYYTEAAGGRVSGALNELRLACERELQRMFVRPLRKEIQDILSDPDLQKRMDIKLTSWHADSIDLGDMAKLLRKAGESSLRSFLPLRMFVEDSTLPQLDKDFLYKALPDFLTRLWDARNLAEHEGKAQIEEMRALRQRALGIGCEGVLPRLARIKKMLKVKFKQ